MNRKAMISVILALALGAGMSVTASAYNPMAAMEDISRNAVATAISEGTIPADATIFDCAYSKDASGKTVVVQYRDKSGAWIDVTTRNAVASASLPVPIATELTEEALAEYADEVFRLTNEAREQAGLAPLGRSDALEEAAGIRAGECASLNSLFVNGKPHIRPDGSRWFTVFGISENYYYGENGGQGKETADAQVASWIKSDGHRANILHEDYTEIGVGVAVSEQGEVFAVQIFSRP